MTIHPTNHLDYSKGDRVDHLFVVDGDEGTALLLTVSDTGLDCVLEGGAGWRDRPRTKGFSLTWAEVFAAVQASDDHDGVVAVTTVRSTADDVDESIEDPRLCDCGKGHWCPLWESWDGPGKTERDALCLEEIHEAIDEEERQDLLEEHTGTLEGFLTEMADLRRRVEETLSNG